MKPNVPESRYLKLARDMLMLAEAHDRWPELRRLYGSDRRELLQYIADQMAEMRARSGALRDDRPSVRLIADETGLPATKLQEFVDDLKVFGAT